MNLVNFMKFHTLSLFNTGQITLPKKWRDQFDTHQFLAQETADGLLIKPIFPVDEVVEYCNEEEEGIFFPKGIDPQVLIDKIADIDG